MVNTPNYAISEIEQRNSPLDLGSNANLFEVVREGEKYTTLVEIRIERFSIRASALLAKIASSYDSDVSIIHNNKSISAKGILGVMALGFVFGDKPKISAIGSDAEECITELSDLVKNRFYQD